MKRALDLLTSTILLVALAPVFVVGAVAVFVSLGRPILFRQCRPGKDGVPFTMYKFRTMLHVDDAEEMAADEVRLTKVGRLLRSTSVDELPQLINVLKGEMSLVGPRPLLMEYLDLYTPEQARRHEVPPGITGWAQIHGRNRLDWTEILRLDVEYVDTRSLALDLRILARTIVVVVRRKGISAKGMATREKFRGMDT